MMQSQAKRVNNQVYSGATQQERYEITCEHRYKVFRAFSCVLRSPLLGFASLDITQPGNEMTACSTVEEPYRSYPRPHESSPTDYVTRLVYFDVLFWSLLQGFASPYGIAARELGHICVCTIDFCIVILVHWSRHI